MKRIYPLLSLLLLYFGAIWIYRLVCGENVAVQKRVAHICIRKGARFAQVVSSLRPYLRNLTAFEELAALKDYPSHIKPGRYEIRDGMSNLQLVNALRIGKQSPVKLIFSREESLKIFAAHIAQQIAPDEQAIYQAFLDSAFLSQHRLDSQTVKQILIPDTYFVYWNISAAAFRDRMLSEYRKFWNAERRAHARAKNLTPLQVSTLASIVQRETDQPEDMPMVAGLYLNRLKHNWKLQSDPTVIYAFKLRYGFDTIVKRVLYSDLKIDSPYNTYKYRGLPPAPIMTPNKRALEAVLHAAQHDYYFMVADPLRPGYHHFSKTFADHNRNRLKYERWIEREGIKR